MRIFKYILEIKDLQLITLPRNAQLLTVQIQKTYPVLWVLLDETGPAYELRRIAIYGTGNPMPNDPGKYIATFQIANGSLVWHVFDLGVV